MSWLFSRVLAEDCLERQRVGSGRSAPLNLIGTADACLFNDKMSESFQPSRYGMTFEPLTAKHGEAVLMWCREDSLAKHLVPRHEDGAQPTIFGLKCVES